MADTNKMRSALGGGLKTAPKKEDLFADTSQKSLPPNHKKVIEADLTLKADVFTERVTLALSKEQKDFLDDLGKEFQRKRTIKLESINRNSILRGLVSVLQASSFSPSDVVNNEQELEALLKRRLLG